MTSRAGFSLDFLSLTCFTAHSPMRMKGVGRREASPKPFPSDFAPRESSPAGLLALGSSAGLRLPDGVVSTSDWLSPCNRRPRLQRRDRHGLAPCSGILDDVRMLGIDCSVKQPWTRLKNRRSGSRPTNSEAKNTSLALARASASWLCAIASKIRPRHGSQARDDEDRSWPQASGLQRLSDCGLFPGYRKPALATRCRTRNPPA